MFHAAHTGDEAFDITFAVSTEFVSGAITVAAGAFAGNDEARINHGADKRYALIDGLLVLFLRMESQAKFTEQEFANHLDIAEELGALTLGNDNEKIVDVATIMFIAEIKTDEAVELIEKDIRQELRGEIADDDAATVGLSEKTFGFREGFPVGATSTDGDIFHGLVIDNFVPEIFKDIIKPGLVGRVTTDAIFNVGTGAMIELLLETPEDTFIEFIVVQAHEIPLNVEFDGESGFGVILCGLTNVASKAFLAVKCTFASATRVGVGNEAAIPPFSAAIIKKMMDDTVTERCSDDFADDGVVDDESDAAARFIKTAHDTIAEIDGVFHGIKFIAVFVDSVLFAFAGSLIGIPKLVQKKSLEPVIWHLETFHGRRGAVYYIRV